MTLSFCTHSFICWSPKSIYYWSFSFIWIMTSIRHSNFSLSVPWAPIYTNIALILNLNSCTSYIVTNGSFFIWASNCIVELMSLIKAICFSSSEGSRYGITLCANADPKGMGRESSETCSASNRQPTFWLHWSSWMGREEVRGDSSITDVVSIDSSFCTFDGEAFVSSVSVSSSNFTYGLFVVIVFLRVASYYRMLLLRLLWAGLSFIFLTSLNSQISIMFAILSMSFESLFWF